MRKLYVNLLSSFGVYLLSHFCMRGRILTFAWWAATYD